MEHTASAAAAALVLSHLDWMRWRNLSPGTIEQRRLTLRRIARFHPDVEMHRLTTAQILAFRDRLTRAGQPLAPQSQAAELAHIGGWCRWLIIEGVREDDPMVRVPRPKLPRGLPHPIAEHDLQRAVATAPDRVRPMLLLAAYAGLRACEIAPLRGDDLWWHADPPLIIIRRAKGGDEQAVPLSPVLEPELRSMARRGYLFPRLDGKLGPIPAHLVSHLANSHLHSLGVWDTLHSLRHRFGTQVYRLSGHDLRRAQELLRHRSPVSTAIYTLLDQADAFATVAALPAVGA